MDPTPSKSTSQGDGQSSPESDGQPLVSVLMNCFNGEAYLKETINSVLKQTYQNWELIFWDNQSTDRSGEICQSYGDSRIRYFLAPEHTNLGPARALACKNMRGEFLAVLDADDLWVPDKLERQLPRFDDEEVGIVISNAVFFNDRGQEKRFYRSGCREEGWVFESLLTRYMVTFQTVVFRIKAIEGVGQGFDPQFSHLADFDLVARTSERWKLACVPAVLSKWRVHEGSGSWQEPERFTEELRAFVEKMDRLNAGTGSVWSRARPAVVRSIAYKEARAALFAGRARECRVRLAEFIGEERRLWVLYHLSFIPGFGPLLKTYLRFRQITPV